MFRQKQTLTIRLFRAVLAANNLLLQLRIHDPARGIAGVDQELRFLRDSLDSHSRNDRLQSKHSRTREP